MRGRGLLVAIGLSLACAPNQQPETEPPVPVKKPGAPPEDLSPEEREEWRQTLEARERERANRPPPKIEIEWPPALETDLAVFNGWWIRLEARIDFTPEHEVTPEAMDVLDDVAFILQDEPRITKVEIQSHRNTELEVYGVKVTQKRANAVKVYLVSQGVEASRLEAKGYGDTMPIESNTTEYGRRANDRIELIVRQIDEHAVNTDQ